jgi:protein-tyrosine phosphatase
VRVCFVCLGNICRSPAAAALFARLADEAGIEVEVDSAGTSGYHLGEQSHEHTVAEGRRRGVDIDHRSQQFTASDFDRFDLVVAMDAANLRDLRRLAPDDAAREKIVAFDVADPFGRPPAAYAEMFDVLEQACQELVARVAAP